MIAMMASLSAAPNGLLRGPRLERRRAPRGRGRPSVRVAALDPAGLQDLVHQAAHHAAVLGYEPVALPCSLQNCGDAVYRR